MCQEMALPIESAQTPVLYYNLLGENIHLSVQMFACTRAVYSNGGPSGVFCVVGSNSHHTLSLKFAPINTLQAYGESGVLVVLL